LSNDGPTVTDFTADVVKVKIGDEWMDMAEGWGDGLLDNPALKRVLVRCRGCFADLLNSTLVCMHCPTYDR